MIIAFSALTTACGGGTDGPPTSPPPGPSSGTLIVVLERSDGWPAPDVHVEVSPLGRSATSDAGGEARFENVPAGEYEVRVIDLDAEPVERAIDFQPPGAPIRLTLPALPAGIRVVWDDRVVPWGDPARLRSRVGGADPAAVVWTSLDDGYLDQPVELARGPSAPVYALRPGTATVEARATAPDGTVLRATVEVEVQYRQAWNVTLAAEVGFPGRTADVWVDGDVALVARAEAGGVSIVALDGTPREVGRFEAPGATTLDVKGKDGIAYVAHDEAPGRGGISIVDLADPARPVLLAEIPKDEAPRVHNAWVEGDRLYATALGGFRAWDVSDPARPRVAASVSVPGTPHDIHVRDGFAYAALMRSGGVGAAGARLMVARADELVPLVFRSWTGAVVHSSWLSADGRYLYVADEAPNAPIRIFDVSDPAAPLEVGRYQPRLGAIPHNFQVRDERIALLAHYEHGVEVVDVSEPTAPRLIGFYDTRSGPDDVGEGSDIHGAWGVHWAADGRIVVGDIDRGLLVLRYVGP